MISLLTGGIGFGALILFTAGCQEQTPPDPAAPDPALIKAGQKATPEQMKEMRRRHMSPPGAR